ncbi:cytochrome C biogenesis protein [Sorangium cellulosum]|uniref:Cytochrome C biogenesis protein n=1 Tax=Sorangium cellulosum TaxID=56 RepID=A0A2L0F9R7_SORCE|nr:cytochrome c-type biogenesis CcmF C-terminal domain-containing protein [Sorangium cellulosum]AUX48257.1 cytochrome C biogenesis protein [Sorangium cellulosum]
MWQSLPEFGTGVLYAILVTAAYTFAVGLASARGRPRLLQAARLGAYGTIALVGLAVLVLAYAFVSHDFRIAYVAQYSDRSMTTPYLIAALWGGQDGSLLWWMFLTALFSGGCVFWLRRRYLELQPYVIATLMSVLIFFAALMIFAVNPFRTSIAGAALDGNGLNYQLRNFYMIIHPPSLYIGFTSAAVPFAFAIAALATGRLDSEWIVATRKWMLFSWLFLSIGNVLGMLWAYEELGWGGPWAWDPVENAAFLPWLTASAYVHSTMIQERRGMLKVWNVSLICGTFFLTIFGTWLTRSGLIASVHSFAQSGIGIWFVGFMAVIIATCTALIVYRLPRLRSDGQFESMLSREAAFLFNNWGLFSIMIFIAVATVWPRISEWLLDQQSTLGPTFYNTWLPPIALVVFLLMGVAPLLGWRKTSPELFRKSFRWPVLAAVVTSTLHLTLGRSVGFAPFVSVDPIYPGPLGDALAKLASTYPFFTVMFAAFNVSVVVQEFARGIAARQKRGDESPFASFYNLVARSRRRYGGYIVHVGIAVMFVGFAGRAWGVDKEVSLHPGEEVRIEEYRLVYTGPRMEVDSEKRMVFADLEVERHGEPVGRISPAKYIYKATPEAPSTEVARHITLKNDLYVIIGMANPQTKVASFQLHVNNLISFMWFGAGILILGALVAMWPDIALEEAGAFGYVRAAGSVTASVVFAFVLAGGPAQAYGHPVKEGFGRPTVHQPDRADGEDHASSRGEAAHPGRTPGTDAMFPTAADPQRAFE